jgi:GT2 family glycosyltransferase
MSGFGWNRHGCSAGGESGATSRFFPGQGISVVIPVYNQLHYTRKCVESLRAHGSGIEEIIIIDNGSTDGTAEYLRGLDSPGKIGGQCLEGTEGKWIPALTGMTDDVRARVIINGENLGCAAAWNQGLEASGGDRVLFLNNDVVLTSGWVEGMVSFAEERAVDIVSPAIREGAGNYDMDRYGKEFVSRMRDHARIGVADGICFLVKRAVFETVGRFDENFRNGQF